MKLPIAFAAGVLLFGAFAIASTLDYQDAQLEEIHYTAAVCQGLWPDYKHAGVHCE